MRVDRIAGLAAGAAVAGGLAAGFALIGTPGHARLVELDRRRADDLGTIAERLSRAHGLGAGRTGALPARLPPAFQVRRFDGSDALRDPATGQSYAYTRESPTRYRLCASFSLPAAGGQAAYRAWPGHPAGRACYHVDTSRSDEPLVVDEELQRY